MQLVTKLAAVAALLIGVEALAADSTKLGYDPQANPFEQLEAALATARAEHKLVLLVAGGDWCVWCHYLAAFLEREPAIDAALHDVFVVAKVYVGDENMNKEFFERLPKAAGAPHFWVVSAGGEVAASQDTLPLENGAKSYDPAAFTAFIERWRARAAQ
jgi:thiol:disulfide interchange protein